MSAYTTGMACFLFVGTKIMKKVLHMLLPLMFVFLIFIWALIKFYALARGPIIQSPFSNYSDLDTKKINECIKNNYERTDLD